ALRACVTTFLARVLLCRGQLPQPGQPVLRRQAPFLAYFRKYGFAPCPDLGERLPGHRVAGDFHHRPAIEPVEGPGRIEGTGRGELPQWDHLPPSIADHQSLDVLRPVARAAGLNVDLP